MFECDILTQTSTTNYGMQFTHKRIKEHHNMMIIYVMTKNSIQYLELK